MKKSLLFNIVLISVLANGQSFVTPFEKSKGIASATYFESIAYYKKLDTAYATISVKTFGITDAGYPLHLILFSKDRQFDPKLWHQQHKVVILVNNGIHPGEPDGIDASMMLMRDIAAGKVSCPSNVVLAIIPVYNIGGCLNRGSNSRVNQNGPVEYGFRGNSQNLDLNRDFTKCDSKEAQSFAQIFHWLEADILIDNHVSDGADYQHTMTLLTTQHNKLGGSIGTFLHDIFEPALYRDMQLQKFPMTPYVNFEGANPDKGWEAFYEPPRFSSGYAALFGTIGFVPETHMLKPFADRVLATYKLMQCILKEASVFSKEIIERRKASIDSLLLQKEFALSWKVDSSKVDTIKFMGYEAGKKISDVTGMERLFYDHSKPYTKEVNFYNFFVGEKYASKPRAYIIPQGWHSVIDLLKLNHVQMSTFQKDTLMEVEAYHIDDYKTLTRAYEKHYRHYDVKVSASKQQIQLLKGDCIIYTDQPAVRFLIEMLEPAGDDSYFAWNFFDGILQQKEGYSDYRWEDVAGVYLQQHPELRADLEEKKKADAKFAASANAQLDYVYKHSPYYEKSVLSYPVYRLN
jgi:hypothetical protein